MKKFLAFTIAILLLLNFCKGGTEEKTKMDPSNNDPVTILCSPELKELSIDWADDFRRENPGITIHVEEVSTSKLTSEIQSGEKIGFSTGQYLPDDKTEGLWKVIVGRDIIVPIINQKNPLINEINRYGVSATEFAGLFENLEDKNWKMLLNTDQDYPLRVYLTGNEGLNASIARFTGTDASKLHGNVVKDFEDVIAAVQEDPFGIGFVRLTSVISGGDHSFVRNIALLPLDKNGNGTLDYYEQIYANPGAFIRGVGIGKYPHTLVSNVYFIASEKPTIQTERAFLDWILHQGQDYLLAAGYSYLTPGEVRSGLDKNYIADPVPISVGNNYATIKTVIMVILVVILVGIIIELVYLAVRYRKSEINEEAGRYNGIFSEETVHVPGGLFFDKTHTWAFMEPDGKVKIGIDDFLQHITGPLTRVKMIEAGTNIKKGDIILSIIQNGKQLNLYSPVSGKIAAQNTKLTTDSSLLNSSPFSDGWVYKIEPSHWLREIQFLSMGKKYKEWLRTEFSRLKDFLADSMKRDDVQFAYQVLQDGGELKDGILSEFGPEVWDDFQTQFIDTSI